MKQINSKKKFIRMIASLLALILSLTMLLTTTVLAAEPNTPKEEVVYINLNSDGSVSEIYVVNIFDLDEDGQIVDYGKYDSLKNMTTKDEIGYSNDTVTIDAKAGKLYYEGKLQNNVMPWNISIDYFINDKEYSSEEIAGMSGDLKIQMSVRQNKECDSSFFEGFALQASLTLDTENFTNISAEGATIANVGSDKQLTYTILPGKETDITISASVKDFEISGFSINAIPLSLNIQIEDEELMGQVTELIDAIKKLDEGSVELHEGVSSLQEGAQNELNNGVKDLVNGTNELQNGAIELKEGGCSLEDGSSDVKAGAEALEEGLGSLNRGVLQIQKGLNELNEKSSSLTEGSSQIKSVLIQIQSALNGISITSDDLSALITASSEIKDGIDNLAVNIAVLEQNISFMGYKAAMAEKGLDIDALKQNNALAIENLQKTIDTLNSQIKIMESTGIDTTQLKALVYQLESITALFGANNASIDGTEAYLTAVNENIRLLSEGASSLQSNYAIIDSKIGTLVDSFSDLVYNLSSLSAAINTLAYEYSALDDGINAYTSGVAEILAGYSEVSKGSAELVTGSDQLKAGTEALYTGTSNLLSGIVELYNATGTLKDGTGKLDEGAAELLAGIAELYSGTDELKNGTSTLREETSGMDTEISDKIDELINSITGENTEIISFVSEDNTNVEAVQFVIQSDAISVGEAAAAEAPLPEELNFWQKLLRLFGLY